MLKPKLGPDPRHNADDWKAALKDGLVIRAELSFTADDVRLALEWSRRMSYSYERDGELPDMLLASAMSSGEVSPDVESVDVG